MYELNCYNAIQHNTTNTIIKQQSN